MRMEKLIQSNLHLDVSLGVHLTARLQQQQQISSSSQFSVYFLFFWYLDGVASQMTILSLRGKGFIGGEVGLLQGWILWEDVRSFPYVR